MGINDKFNRTTENLNIFSYIIPRPLYFPHISAHLLCFSEIICNIHIEPIPPQISDNIAWTTTSMQTNPS